MATYSYRCVHCDHRFSKEMTVEQMLDTTVVCPLCSGASVRHIPIDFINTLSHPLINAKSNFDSKYPYVSLRLPKRMAGCRHTPNGNTIIDSKQHEREVMAGASNGDRYERE